MFSVLKFNVEQYTQAKWEFKKKKYCISFQQKTPMGTCSNITCYLDVYTNHDQHVVCQLAAFLNKIYNCVMQNFQSML